MSRGGEGRAGGRPLLIYGAGGHGMVAAEAAAAAGWRVVALLDDARQGGAIAGIPLVAPAKAMEASPSAPVLVAVGDNGARRALCGRLVMHGRDLASVVHPAAWVSPTATLGRGVFIGPSAVVNAAASVGEGAIVNSGAIVEHHCRVGAFAHLAPRAALCGHVEVGDETLVGVGAVVRPRTRVGARCTIGAGAAVVSDIGDDVTAVGVPARAW